MLNSEQRPLACGPSTDVMQKSSTKASLLCDAARDGDIDEVRRLIWGAKIEEGDVEHYGKKFYMFLVVG